jgi:hypothetical protein
MGNYAQNAANRRFPSPSQYAQDLLAYRRGVAYTRLRVVLENGAEDLFYAISLAPEPQKTEYAEMFMRAFCGGEE